MHALTPRQMDVVRFIRNFRSRRGYSPTLQEIGNHMGLTRVTVFEHVGALERKGVLTRGPKHHARSLQLCRDLVFEDEGPTKLALLGRIAAGRPIEAIEDRQTLDLEEFVKKPSEAFALRVTGDSMIGEHIVDGDYVICRRTSRPRNGQIVVALLPDGEATLKKFYRQKGRIKLEPAHEDYEPIYATDVTVQGVVTGVIRRT